MLSLASRSLHTVENRIPKAAVKNVLVQTHSTLLARAAEKNAKKHFPNRVRIFFSPSLWC
jgi:hypothetical protein